MDRKFLEKLIIAIVIFLGVTIATAYIIGNYVVTKKEAERKKFRSTWRSNCGVRRSVS